MPSHSNNNNESTNRSYLQSSMDVSTNMSGMSISMDDDNENDNDATTSTLNHITTTAATAAGSAVEDHSHRQAALLQHPIGYNLGGGDDGDVDNERNYSKLDDTIKTTAAPGSSTARNNHHNNHHHNYNNHHNPKSMETASIDSWDIENAKKALREATHILSQRGLKLASKWSAEQLIGLAPTFHNNNDGGTKSHYSTGKKRFDFQKVGGDADNDDNDDDNNNNGGGDHSHGNGEEYRNTHHMPLDGNDLELYAKSILDMGEYHRAAAVLSINPSIDNPTNTNETTSTNINSHQNRISRNTKHNSGDLTIQPPLSNLTPYGTFLRSYAIYMAGERRKEEEVLELRDPLERTTVMNSYLPQLVDELHCLHKGKKLDAFGLYIFGVVLKEIQKSPTSSSRHGGGKMRMMNATTNRRGSSGSSSSIAAASATTTPRNTSHLYSPNLQNTNKNIAMMETTPSAQSILIQSLIQYPYNWSAWLDLAEICIIEPSIHIEVETLLKPISHHWMYHFFCVHSFLENQANEDAIMVMEKLVHGNNDSRADGRGLNNGNQGFFISSPYLQTQLAVAHNNLRDFDTAQVHFTRSSECDPHRLDNMDVYSNILYVKEDKVSLSNLAHRAVKLDKYRPETCCIVGNYYSLKGQHEKAVQYFQRALKLDRSYLSAWTLMGHEYLEMRNTAAAIEAYRRAVDINSKDYRAWYGLGQIYEIMNMLLYALFYFQKAVEILPNDPRMWCAMGKCYLGLDRKSNAIRSYERAVANNDFEGVATWELATLYNEEGDVEKAARCYLRHLELVYQAQQSQSALSSDGATVQIVIASVNIDQKEAEALLNLAAYHRDHGKFNIASLCCTRLLDYHGHPEREQAKSLLREIKNQENRNKITTRNEDSFEFSP